MKISFIPSSSILISKESKVILTGFSILHFMVANCLHNNAAFFPASFVSDSSMSFDNGERDIPRVLKISLISASEEFSMKSYIPSTVPNSCSRGITVFSPMPLIPGILSYCDNNYSKYDYVLQIEKSIDT
jgi:hypothetical protein